MICIAEGNTAGLDLMRRRTLLHEFAHAWDRANLDRDSRRTLMFALGTDVWTDDGQTQWRNRGAERLAEAFVHSLLDQKRRPVMAPLDFPELVGVFEMAARTSPPGPNLPWCAGVPGQHV